jgi:hypothetical protein
LTVSTSRNRCANLTRKPLAISQRTSLHATRIRMVIDRYTTAHAGLCGDISILLTTNFTGIDSFSYFVSDGRGGTSAGSVTVIVGGQPGSKTLYLPLVRR